MNTIPPFFAQIAAQPYSIRVANESSPSAEASQPSASASSGTRNDRHKRPSHPTIRAYEANARQAKNRRTEAPSPLVQGHRASGLLAYSQRRAEQEMRRFDSFLQVNEQIDAKLTLLCKRKNGRADDPELAACKKFIVGAAANLLIQQGEKHADILASLETAQPAKDLSQRLSMQSAALQSCIAEKDWVALNKNPSGYALLALVVLKDELNNVYAMADIVRCAKKGSNGQELVALLNPDCAAAIPDNDDRIRVASNGGGWKNLEAAMAYREELSRRRTKLRENLLENALAQGTAITAEQLENDVDHAMAPFTIPMPGMVRILSHDGGSKNLEAAMRFLTDLYEQRTKLRENLLANARTQGTAMTVEQLENEVDQAVAPFTISMPDMVRILSNDGGSKNLTAAMKYLTVLFEQRTKLRENLLENARTRGKVMTAKELQHKVDKAMAPFTIPMPDMVRILSHGGGSKNLEAATQYLTELFEQRTKLRENLLQNARKQGTTMMAEDLNKEVDQAMAPFTIPMLDMVRILSNGGGSKNLEAATQYLTGLFAHRTILRENLLENARAGGTAITAENLNNEVDQAMAPFTIPMADMVSILSHNGGSKNLEAATQYMTGLLEQRTKLRQILLENARTQGTAMTSEQLENEVHQAMAPLTIPMPDMVSILSHGGGSKNLEAATQYLTGLFAQRTKLRENLLENARMHHTSMTAEDLDKEVDQAMAPFTIPMRYMARILSNHGGWKNLDAATQYLTELFAKRTKLRENLLENAQAQGMPMTAKHLEHKVNEAMAPFTINMEIIVSTVAKNGGSHRLNELLKTIRT